jgi:inorganic triphosphatase YgiF
MTFPAVNQPRSMSITELVEMILSEQCKAFLSAIEYAEVNGMTEDLIHALTDGSVLPFADLQEKLVNTFLSSCSYEEENRIRAFNWTLQKHWEETQKNQNISNKQ